MKTQDREKAYSYVRFSSAAQAEGDSLRRQTKSAAAYCARHGLTLDTSLTLRDLGVSAFRGKNAAVGNFRTFLDAVRDGKVAPGSVLIVESFDRISRQGIDEGYDLVKSILKAGVKIATLAPERLFDREATKSLSKGALEIQFVLERAAEESERKSERVGEAWSDKRDRARAEGHVLTKKLPAWVQYRDGKLVLDAAKAATVKRIFALAAAGRGYSLIRQELTAQKVPTLTGATKWARASISKILRDRHAVGELQPRTRDGKPDGKPIPNYYPAAVTEDEFNAARAGAAERRKKPGRTGSNVNVFAGLLRDPRNGAAFYYAKSNARGSAARLTTAETAQGAGVSVRYHPFETHVLDRLREVDTREVEGTAPKGNETDADALERELDALDARIAQLEAELKKGDIASISRTLRELDAERKEKVKALAEANELAACSAGEAFGQVKTLAALIATSRDPDGTRLKLRGVLRRAVADVQLVVVPRGAWSLCAVQVNFRDTDLRRVYLMGHRRDQTAMTPIRDLAWKAGPGEIDLRNARDAETVARSLRDDFDLAILDALLPVRNRKKVRAKAHAERRANAAVRNAEWKAMRAAGKSYAAIAEEAGVSTNTVYNAVNGAPKRDRRKKK